MNEQSLFRGKRKDNGEWVEGNLIKRRIWSSEFYVIRVEDNGFDSYVEYEVIPETVGQCTGLKDKNGKLIFEGDIVVSTSDRRLSDRPRLITIDFERGCHYCAAKRKPVVIGNIHDNPNLLKLEHDRLCEIETYKRQVMRNDR